MDTLELCNGDARIADQRGSVLITCLVISAVLFLLVLGVSQMLQLGWRQVGNQWQMSKQEFILVWSLYTIAQQPATWMEQPCVHSPLLFPDASWQDAQQWQAFTACRIIVWQHTSQFVVERLVPQPEPVYRITAKLASFTQQLTIRVNEQGQVRRQAWRNMI